MGSLYMSTGWVATPCAQLLLLELPLAPADSGLAPPWRQYGPAWVPSATLASPGVTWHHLASPGITWRHLASPGVTWRWTLPVFQLGMLRSGVVDGRGRMSVARVTGS